MYQCEKQDLIAAGCELYIELCTREIPCLVLSLFQTVWIANLLTVILAVLAYCNFRGGKWIDVRLQLLEVVVEVMQLFWPRLVSIL